MKIVKAPHPSSGHYSAAIISNGMIYVSGQSSVDPFTHQVPEGGMGPEMKMSQERIEHILQEAGADRSHIVMCRVFITDMSKWDEANAAYAEFFGEHKPARAIYEVRRTHHMAQIEVEAIAEV